MSVLNDRDITNYAFREALARESHMNTKLKTIYRSTRDINIKKLCLSLLASGESRMAILSKGMKNLNIK
ncbi:MAG: hypothetical protein ACOY30_14760 [Bacillota bacterium]